MYIVHFYFCKYNFIIKIIKNNYKMVIKCDRCKVQFTTEYLLSKHQNKKIQCGIIFECERCKKILSTQYSLERHYNKKNPCIEVKYINKPVKSKIILEKQKEISLEIQKIKEETKENERRFKLELLERKEEEKRIKMIEDRRIRGEKRDALEIEVHRETMLEFEREQIKIQLAMEKTKQIELKIQMQKEKNANFERRKDLEYSRSDKKSRDNMTYIRLYAENNKQKKEDALEILKAKAETMKSVELIKTERKEQTAQIINNNVTINNINICINHIKDHHMDKLNIEFKQMQPLAMEYLKQNTTDCDETKSAKFLLNIFNSHDTCNGILDHVLRMAYNSVGRDDKRCVWYMKTPEYYFAGTVNKDEITVELIDFDKELFPLLRNMLSTTLIKITAAAEKYVKMTCDYENEKNQDNFIKHKNLLYYQRNVLPFTDCLKDIKNMSDKVFEIESPLVRS